MGIDEFVMLVWALFGLWIFLSYKLEKDDCDEYY